MIRTATMPRSARPAVSSAAETAVWLRELAEAPQLAVFGRLDASPKGLTEPEATERLARYGDNVVDPPARLGAAGRVATAVRSPFVALLAALGLVFAGLGDLRGALTVAVMVTLSMAVRFWQHTHSDRAVAALRARVSMTTTVRRRAEDGHRPSEREVPSQDLVPGDVVLLEPGDLVPADVRVLSASDLVVDQSALSGEAMPVAKREPAPSAMVYRRHLHDARRSDRGGAGPELVDLPALCFVGTSVVSGTATAVVIATGPNTYAGSIARQTTGERPESSFDRGVRTVGWTLIRFMLVLVPIVLVVNGTVTGDWTQAVMFAMAVAVGLTPEMLPVIVTTNLARGAVRLAHPGATGRHRWPIPRHQHRPPPRHLAATPVPGTRASYRLTSTVLGLRHGSAARSRAGISIAAGLTPSDEVRRRHDVGESDVHPFQPHAASQ